MSPNDDAKLKLGPKGKEAVSAFLSYVAASGNVSEDARMMAYVLGGLLDVPIAHGTDTAERSARLGRALGEITKKG